jgi:hypothetical protein
VGRPAWLASERGLGPTSRREAGQGGSTTTTANGQKTLVTKSLGTTRFIASTLQSFASIQRCFHHYVQAMYNFGGMRHNINESFSEDEHMLVGQDSVIDLLFVSDIQKQLVDLMVVS